MSKTNENPERIEIGTGKPDSLHEVLGCPFCGEMPEYSPRAQGHAPEYWWPHTLNHNCKVVGQQICVRAHNAGLPDTKESVFQIWNTRAAGHPNS
jgi:hypothetical protein